MTPSCTYGALKLPHSYVAVFLASTVLFKKKMKANNTATFIRFHVFAVDCRIKTGKKGERSIQRWRQGNVRASAEVK